MDYQEISKMMPSIIVWALISFFIGFNIGVDHGIKKEREAHSYVN